MQNVQNERRRATRLQRSERIAIRPLVRSSDAYMTTVYCSSIDISAHGLKIQLDYLLPLGQMLDLSVTLERAVRPFSLAGEIRWTSKLEASDTYSMGLALCEPHLTDIKRWRRLFAKHKLAAFRPYDTAHYSETQSPL